MKANELRIGNIVTRQGIEGKLTAIGENGFGYFVPNKFVGDIGIQITEIEPIPLTEEWLIKLGFKVETKTSHSFGYAKDYKVYTLDSFTYNSIQAQWWWHGVLPHQPEYVHQLQNLFFALTSTELELTKTV